MSKSTAVTVLDQFDPQKLPAHMADFGDEGNIQPKQTVPSLSYEGKTWTVILNGEKKRLTRKNEDGEVEPLQTFKGVILNYAQRRGRTYYEGAYDPNKPATPLCWSDDGVTPHDSIESPMHSKCEGCPMSIKGSRQTEQGKATTACSQHRMLVVVPASKLDFEPLRMKLAITSDWDNQSPDLEAQGWYAFQQYLDLFRAKKVPHTAMVVTKFKFDPGTAFPKVLFSPDRWLNEDELATVRSVWKSDKVKALLSGAWSPNGGDGTKTDAPPAQPGQQALQKLAGKPKAAPAPAELDDDEEAAPPPPKAAAKPKKPAPPPEEDEDGLDLEDTPAKPAPKAAGKPAKAAPPDDDDMGIPEMLDRRSPAVKAAAKGKKAPPPEEDAEELQMEEVDPPKKPKAAAAAPAKGKGKGAAEAPGDLDDLLGEWGEGDD